MLRLCAARHVRHSHAAMLQLTGGGAPSLLVDLAAPFLPARLLLVGHVRTAVPGVRRQPFACCCCRQVRSRKPAAVAVQRLTRAAAQRLLRAAAQLTAAQARTPAALLHHRQLFSSPARQLDTAEPTTMQPPHSRPPRPEAATLGRRSQARSPPQGPQALAARGPGPLLTAAGRPAALPLAAAVAALARPPPRLPRCPASSSTMLTPRRTTARRTRGCSRRPAHRRCALPRASGAAACKAGAWCCRRPKQPHLLASRCLQHGADALAPANLPAARFIVVHSHAWRCTSRKLISCLQHVSVATPVSAHAPTLAAAGRVIRRRDERLGQRAACAGRRLHGRRRRRAVAGLAGRAERVACHGAGAAHLRGARAAPGHRRASAWLGASL